MFFLKLEGNLLEVEILLKDYLAAVLVVSCTADITAD